MPHPIDEVNVNIPVISAIIQRGSGSDREILLQLRWKPERDPIYSGTWEIPAGWMDKYENVYETVKREVSEETGLNVTKIFPDIKTVEYKGNKDDASFAFVPFCCQQQLKGGKPWVGFVFVCEVDDNEPVVQIDEVKEIKWVKIKELRHLITNQPESIFMLQVGVLNYYIDHIPDF